MMVIRFSLSGDGDSVTIEKETRPATYEKPYWVRISASNGKAEKYLVYCVSTPQIVTSTVLSSTKGAFH